MSKRPRAEDVSKRCDNCGSLASDGGQGGFGKDGKYHTFCSSKCRSEHGLSSDLDRELMKVRVVIAAKPIWLSEMIESRFSFDTVEKLELPKCTTGNSEEP